ncbi:MAG: TRM11 family SAM-dependent methyltransferase [Nocardioidaceae bacterium]
MRPYMLQTFAELDRQRPDGQESVHFTESLAQAVIEEYSAPGDLVLDPFAGFGTTLCVADRLGRRALGVELLPERVAHVRARGGRVVEGDARRLTRLVEADREVALTLTSPPYMTSNGHPENPLDAYESLTGDYARYLAELGDVFGQVAELLRPGGHAVVNVANISHEGVHTPLAWDVARAVGAHLTMVQECFLCWDRQPEEITGDYCLVFRKA